MRVHTTSDRVFAIDAVRGFAIFAMVIAHTASYIQPAPRVIVLAEGVINDVAAPLFALIIGVTITLTAPKQTPGGNRSRTSKYRLQTVVKGLALIGIGVLLEMAPSGAAIVLGFLGMTLICLAPLLYMKSRTLLILAGLLTLVGPGITMYLRTLSLTMTELVYPKNLLTILLDWFVLSAHYQVPVFVSMGLIGIVIGRFALGNRRALSIMLVVSFPLFFVMQMWKGLDLPGSEIRGSYVEVLREAPLAIGTFAAIILLTDLASSRVRKFTIPAFQPFAVSGRMALSLYVLHITILMLLVQWRYGLDQSGLTWATWPRGLLIQIGLILVCWGFAYLWDRFLGTGPVERLLRFVSGRRARSEGGTGVS